jgi:hypothetical protein
VVDEHYREAVARVLLRAQCNLAHNVRAGVQDFDLVPDCSDRGQLENRRNLLPPVCYLTNQPLHL